MALGLPLGPALGATGGGGRPLVWQNLAASRAFSVGYVNTTSEYIRVSVNAQSTAAGYVVISATVGGVSCALSEIYAPAGGGYSASVLFEVPPGQSYSVNASGSGAPSLGLWAELAPAGRQ